MNFDFELEEDILLEIQEALMDLVIKNPDEKYPCSCIHIVEMIQGKYVRNMSLNFIMIG